MTTSISLRKGFLIFGALNLFLILQTFAQPNYPRDPKEAELIYADLVHFVDAYKELAENKDTIQVLNTLYFDRGTAGLKEFINRHQLTPELLKEAMKADPDRYALIPSFLEGIDEEEVQFKALMQEYHKVMPNTMYAPTYLLVGANRGIGQASMVGQLITLTRVVDNRSKLHKLITHEMSHFQQAMTMGGQKYVSLYSTPDNMLGLCLREGGAEFITYLVLGDITRPTSLEYIENDEEHLKQKFLEELNQQNQDYWLWASLEDKENPGLLGYAMGYKICKQYYDQALDKNKALHEILKMDEAEAFLKSSGYLDDASDK